MLMSQIYCFRLLLALDRFLPMWRGNYSILSNNPPVLSVIIVELNPIDRSLLLSYLTYYKSFAIFKLPPLYFVYPPPRPRAPSPPPLEFCKGVVLNHSWDECNLIISSTSCRQQWCKVWRQTFNSYGQHENDECRKTPYSLMRRLRLLPNLTPIWKQMECRPLKPKKTGTGPFAQVPSFPEALIRVQIL